VKILLTAFACDPTRGSDAGVGWRWAETLAAKGHDVWVLTRTVYRSHIESELASRSGISNLYFVYFDHDRAAAFLYRVMKRLHLYYYLWQFGAYRLARQVHQRENFDCVHHVTWVSVRLPSFMGNLGIPFIFGPVAGGESAPYSLRSGYGLRAWLADGFRDISNWLVQFDPFMRSTFAKAARIYVTSRQTMQVIPRKFRHKARVRLAIASDLLPPSPPSAIVSIDALPPAAADPIRLLFVGRLLELKGMHLGFRAFARMLATHPNARMTIVGTGPAEARWRGLAERLGISRSIDWIPWVPHSEVGQFYGSHDLFLFPSLHDSGGMVVLEAMAQGLPVVCLDIGGPGVLVDQSCGFAVPTRGRTQFEVVESMSEALVALTSSTVRAKLRQGAFDRVRSFTWTALIDDVYEQQ
jgi:glycosyltransferase involved in cell wall biosynthesis